MQEKGNNGGTVNSDWDCVSTLLYIEKLQTENKTGILAINWEKPWQWEPK